MITKITEYRKLQHNVETKINEELDLESEEYNELANKFVESLNNVGLKKLEDIFKEHGIDTKLTISHKPDRYDRLIIKILSEDLKPNGGPLADVLYEYIRFESWGGTLVNENELWVNPKLTFRYKLGGSNGTNFIWNSLWYKLDTEEWIVN